MHVRKRDGEDLLTLRLHDALVHETTELTSHYFIPRVLFASEPTHGCMVGVNSEYLFSTLIADCGVILVHDLSEFRSIVKTRRPDRAQTNLGVQKGKRLEAFRFDERVYPERSTVD
jgi:hypothetical protein